ncbi:MAG: tRNA pseudouridine(38-40) synthase TruA [Breznakibacter sp.]
MVPDVKHFYKLIGTIHCLNMCTAAIILYFCYLMARYFVELAYKGTQFHGWQVQPNAVSVQSVLEDAFGKALRSDVEIVGAGRTDAGVHALYYVAHFDLAVEITDSRKLIDKVNRILPRDVAVSTINQVPGEAHSRFHATWREYEYWVVLEKRPFLDGLTYRLWRKPDFDLMNQAANLLFLHTDFSSFSKLHTDVKTNNCKIYKAEWTSDGEKWIFTIRADRFLRNMVRAVVGTLLEVGYYKISLKEFETIIYAKDRCKAGVSVPPEALYLVDIAYPPDIFTRQSHPFAKS